MSETSDIIKQKNIKRGYIKATLTRLATFSKQNLSSCSKDELLVKKQRLIEAFSEYEELNQDLLYLNPNDDENIVLVEETYYQTLTCFNQTLNSGNLQEPTAYNTTAQCSQRTKLPAINIGSFNDGYTARAYQLERNQDADPAVEEFLKYLERRALALESVEPSQNAQHTSVDNRASTTKSRPMAATHIVTGAQCSHSRVKIIGRDGTEYHVRALLDSCSQVSFVSSKLVKLLGGKPKSSDLNIIGITNKQSTIKACIPIEIQSLRSPYKTTITCQIVESVTCNLPQNKINLTGIQIPKNVVLADEKFYEPGEINMLISSDVVFQTLLLQTEPIKIELPEQPPSPAQPPSTASGPQSESTSDSTAPAPRRYLSIINTEFGHIVGGNIPCHLAQAASHKVVLKCTLAPLNDTIAQFWNTEKVPEIFSEKSSEQELCEEVFQSTVKLEDNKFQVALPLKLPLSEVNDALGDSFHFAHKRFLNLEKKLHANPALFNQYKEFINEYLQLNHGHYIDIEMYDLNKDAVYFLPHRAVINENSKTTPVRTVFDASMLTNKKISLNDLQLNGPTVQRDLYDIIILFRLGKFTFTTDIRRMFRNINVDPAYTSLQNILWRESPTETLKVIRLDSVTYGLKSSSYLATRCLDELATRYRNDYPLASSIIKENTYVDDIIYSHNDLNTILSAKDQLCNLLKLGSFHTHKWSTNDERILEGIPSTERKFESLNLQKDDYNMKALGLQLNINDDKFIISSPEPFNPEKITKRTILSYIGRIYDPMGYVGPIVVTAKAIMQRLWSSSCSWNDSPPQDVQKEWLQYTERLAKMQPITLARNIDFSDSHTAQLIGFADASSTTGYGCCLYLRLIDASGTKVTTHLLSSKSRINPVQKKNMTVPRLELNAALLLSKLVVKTYATLQLKIEIKNVYLFSDSQVVLAWLKTEITKLQAYVANRVNVIHQNTSRWRWLYVNTHENPADLISRGVQPGELNGNNLWWRGPEFLQNSKWDLSCNEPKIPQEVPEVRSCAVLASAPVCIKPNPLEFADHHFAYQE
ncbi:unnamed protein product [Plutella xylostella]|uniref:(diamondback moth) hypothetical protein n=1 Tax=Plutella xylostella TaxID=51655 RepID=A0A8S4ESZ9_PLUXY|nr:unnamed protein product [Plutella xylostella]